MVAITFLGHDGTARVVDAVVGASIMAAAINNGIDAIEGECGGVGACATCHVYIPAEWQALTGTASEDELTMLEFGAQVDDRSRLGCQIAVTPAMDGMVVITPASQR